MRKIRITSITSIIGTRLISSGSFVPAALEVHRSARCCATGRSRCARRARCRPAWRPRCSISHDEAVDLVAEVPVEDQRRDRDADAEGGVVERDRDAVRELLRVGAGRRLRAEDLDHADHRAEQAEQRRRGGDGAERGEEALQLVRHARARPPRSPPSSRSASCLWLRRPAASTVAERRVLGELVEHLARHALALVDRDHLVEQRRRDDPACRAATTERSMISATAMTEASSRARSASQRPE